MKTAFSKNREQTAPPYVSMLGAWALAFGCSVGWGAFTLPGTKFLPFAGPVGSALALVLGALVMLLIAANYHYLMNGRAEKGGAYAYARSSFGCDHGLLTAWFLALTYLAILWASASAFPLAARMLFGGALQFGFRYEIAGYTVYLGEALASIAALGLAAALCLRRILALWAQIVMALALFFGVAVRFIAALANGGAAQMFHPAFAPEHSPFAGVVMVLALAPMAYAGFASVSHSAAEACYSRSKSFAVLAAALATGGVVWAMLSLLAVTAPDGAGSKALGLAALCAVMTGMIACYIALSRLFRALSHDALLPAWFGGMNGSRAPRNAIVFLLAVSAVFPFLGGTVTGWIADAAIVGAVIVYAVVSAAAWKTARTEKKPLFVATGIIGFVISVFFALELLIPSFSEVETLSAGSYMILAVWGITGLLYFRHLLTADRKKRLGRSVSALLVLLSVTIFTASVWLLQSVNTAVERAMAPVQQQCLSIMDGTNAGTPAAAAGAIYEALSSPIRSIGGALTGNVICQVGVIVLALGIVLDIYAFIQRRERQTEIERAVALDAGRAKASFLSNMSHEIRTPMNAIIGLDSIALRNPDLTPQTREQLEKIGSSAKHLLGLISDMMDMGRIESGGVTVKDEEFPLRQFLDQLNTETNAQCMEKGLTYECSIVGRVGDYYSGDEAKLKKVLTSILNNAVKFTDAPGRVLLTVEQPENAASDCALRFTVRDTGIGMDEAFLPKLFEPFSQEDLSNTSRYGGSGLSLAISKRYVDMMRGSILVESQKGIGSTFTVTVPLKHSERRLQLEQIDALPEKMRAVVVDDDAVSGERTRLVLKDIGVAADCFTDPWEAIERIRKAQKLKIGYELVITNYKLPGMNGLELTRMIRECDGGRTVIIMLTGYNWDIIADEAMGDGVDSIGAKPLFADSLLRELHTILARKEGRDVPAEDEQEEPIESVLAGRRVLMAEDIDLNAEVLCDILELESVGSERAYNGKLAVEMFQNHPMGYYDAILMDVRMPVMDGLTATETIRAMDRPDAKTIPIIAMTANVFDEDIELSKKAGMNAHLAKPVEPELLYRTMARLMKGNKT